MTSLSAWLVSGSSVKLIGLYGSDAGDVQFVEAFVCEVYNSILKGLLSFCRSVFFLLDYGVMCEK